MTLTACERECILGCADDEHHWHVYVDVPSRFAKQLQALARTWGVEPRHLGAGVEFELPLQAVRFTRPRRTSERQRRAARASIQKARLALRNPVKIQAVEGVGAPARGGGHERPPPRRAWVPRARLDPPADCAP